MPAELGVAGAEDHVRPVEDLCGVGVGDAHHLADDLERERCGERLDEVGRAAGVLVEHAIDELCRLALDVLLDLGDLLRGEALGDDRSQPEVLGVVHRDHRAEELVELLGEVADLEPPAGAEQLGMAAGVPDVVVSGHGVVPGAGRKRRVLEHALGVERETGSGTQGLERCGACPSVA